MNARWRLAVAAGLLAGACGNPLPVVEDGGAYDPEADAFADPPSLYELYPVAEPDRALSDTTIVRHDFAQPATLNPLFPSGAASAWTMFGMLFEWLVIRHGNPSDYDWNTNVVREARWSEDLLSVTLDLNPDLRWHDGEPWTAADVAFSLEALRDERVPVSFWPTARDLVVGATAEGEHRVRFDFAGLLAPQLRLEALAFPIMPRHILGNPAERAADPTLRSSPYYNRYGREAVIGSGPFRFVEWRNNDRVVLERWEDHYLFESAPPAARTMIFKFQPDRNLAFLQFLGGEYDQTYVDANIFARQATGPLFEERAVKGRHASALLLCIVWNMDGSNPFFGDPLVRRALAHAYDAETVLRRVGHGLYRRSYGFMVEERWDYEPAILERPYDYDLARAAELLDRAGWLADPDTGWRHKEVGGERIRFSFELSYTAGMTYIPPTLDILREDFRRLGVEMVTRAYESASLNEKRLESEFQALGTIGGTTQDPNALFNQLATDAYDGGRNNGGYSNPRVDELFELGKREQDSEKRDRDLPGDSPRGVPGPAGAVPVPRQFPVGLRQRRPRCRTRSDGHDPAVADPAGRLAVPDRPGLVARARLAASLRADPRDRLRHVVPVVALVPRRLLGERGFDVLPPGARVLDDVRVGQQVEAVLPDLLEHHGGRLVRGHCVLLADPARGGIGLLGSAQVLGPSLGRAPDAGRDPAGAEDADADVVRQFRSQHVGDGEHRVLRGGVDGRTGEGDAQAVLGAGVHDAGLAAALDEPWREHADAVEHPLDVDAEDPPHVIGAEAVGRRPPRADTGVVEQQLDGSEGRPGLVRQVLQVLFACHVDLRGQSLYAENLDLTGDALRGVQLQVGDRDVRALSGEGQRDRAADAVAAAGDDRRRAG